MHMAYGLIVDELDNMEAVLYKYLETDDIYSPYVEFFKEEGGYELAKHDYNQQLSKLNYLLKAKKLNLLNIPKEKIETAINETKYIIGSGLDDYVENYLYYYVQHRIEDGKLVTDLGHYYNPNSLYDWSVLGGRWSGLLLVDEGITSDHLEASADEEADEIAKSLGLKRVDAARIKDIRFDQMRKFKEIEAKNIIEKVKKDPDKYFYLQIKTKADEENFIKNHIEFSLYGLILEDEEIPYHFNDYYQQQITTEEMMQMFKDNEDRFLAIYDFHM